MTKNLVVEALRRQLESYTPHEEPPLYLAAAIHLAKAQARDFERCKSALRRITGLTPDCHFRLHDARHIALSALDQLEEK